MYRSTQQTLSLPPFTPTVTWLLAINTAVFFALTLLGLSDPLLVARVMLWFGLQPSAAVHGWVWQVVTYSMLHASFIHWFFNMLALWMFGPQIEGIRGSRYFFELYLAGVIGGALFSIGLSYSGALGDPGTVTVGASAGIYAVLMAFGILFAESEIILIPLPMQIKAKYLVAILIVVTLVFSLQERRGIADIAHLGGLLFGYFFVKFVPRRGLSFKLSESYYVIRNSFHKVKRRLAARKFEVYMRDMEKRSQSPEEQAPLHPPDDKRNGPGGWVN
ncbi:MAG TPA: rhomboid family intramembrane serine protease [Alphaproteobacteria bacterium]|nr:rhomboid family intramembrane serine protease [Alphaproteobacteria bacterium]